MPIAHRRGREIEPRGVDVAGLDAIEAGIPVHQVVVIAHLLAAEHKCPRREITVFARELVIERQRQPGDVARRRALVWIGQARGVVINRRIHPELTRLPTHLLGEGRFAAAQRFGHHHRRVIRRFGHDAKDQIVHRDGLARHQTELAGSPACRLGGHPQILIKPQLALIERLEGQIKRHHLGQRRRRRWRIGAQFAQHLPGLGVEDDRFVSRRGNGRIGCQHDEGGHDNAGEPA